MTPPRHEDAPVRAPVPDRERRRNRWLLVVIAVAFFGTALVAGGLRLSGYQPQAKRQHGELLSPYGDLREVAPRLVEGGGDYRWEPAARQWRIVAVPPPGCAQPCVELTRQLDLVWQLSGRHADRVHVLWAGAWPEGGVRHSGVRVVAPDPALRAGLPRVDDAAGVPVYIVDPNGFVILRYAPGFDPAHLREDLARLLKLK